MGERIREERQNQDTGKKKKSTSKNDKKKADNFQLKKKWIRDLNRIVTKGDIQRANKYIKRYSTALVIREMQFKMQ